MADRGHTIGFTVRGLCIGLAISVHFLAIKIAGHFHVIEFAVDFLVLEFAVSVRLFVIEFVRSIFLGSPSLSASWLLGPQFSLLAATPSSWPSSPTIHCHPPTSSSSSFLPLLSRSKPPVNLTERGLTRPLFRTFDVRGYFTPPVVYKFMVSSTAVSLIDGTVAPSGL